MHGALRVVLSVPFLLLCACDPDVDSPTDTGRTNVPDSGVAEALDAGDGGGLDAASCAVADERPWFVDCDGDGFAASVAASVSGCDAPEAAPSGCAGAGGEWTERAPVDDATTDCNDADSASTVVDEWWPDCDGDDHPGPAMQIESCGPPLSTPGACGLGELSEWTNVPAAPASTDCDDHLASVGAPNPWYVDCDEDGYAPMGLGMVEGCAAPTEPPAPCAGAGGWTARAPTNDASADCDDQAPLAHPGQIDFFTEPVPPSMSSYDYDCDGVEEPQVADVYFCSVSETGPNMYTCTRPIGDTWNGSFPACGDAGELASGCTLSPSLSCSPAVVQTSTQACR